MVETMASVRAALLLLPPLSVVVAMAARCLCRVMARKLSALARSQLACLPSSGGPSSIRYLEDGGGEQDEDPPVALYHRRDGDEEEEEEEEQECCVLCLSGIEEGSEVRELRCRHLFHRGCLDRWVRVAATCPLCRGRLLASPPWYCYDYDYDYEEEEEEESDMNMMLFMACVHSRSSWLWPSS